MSEPASSRGRSRGRAADGAILITMADLDGFDDPERAAEDEREARLKQLGRELGELMPADDEWKKLNERAKTRWIRRVHQLMQERMDIQQATRIRIIHRGYEEETGDILVPSPDLGQAPDVLVGLLCHELEHARQFDVMMHRAEPPRAWERQTFETGYDEYDPTDTFKYSNNPLEHDANDRAAELMHGFHEVRPPDSNM
jgi:hypothetical protein